MVNVTENLLSVLLGDVFVGWLNCEPVRYLLAFLFIGMIIKFVFSFIKL